HNFPSSQNSIQTSARFMLKHQNRYGEDLWDCLVEECEKASLNSRINILYLIDSLLIISSTNSTLSAPSSTKPQLSSLIDDQHHQKKQIVQLTYGDLIRRDIIKLIKSIVPVNFKKKGVLNLMSTQQVLKNWRNQLGLIERFEDLELIKNLDKTLNEQKSLLAEAEADAEVLDNKFLDFSKREILDRIDDDRERNKRLREQIWILPIPPLSSFQSNPNVNSITINYSNHRSATLLYRAIKLTLIGNNSSAAQPSSAASLKLPNLDFDLTISLECDQLINSQLEHVDHNRDKVTE
ncbi:CTD kinase subunit gamma CTK3-domain-containing protein, partial [Phakopsora pachyrhizi]